MKKALIVALIFLYFVFSKKVFAEKIYFDYMPNFHVLRRADTLDIDVRYSLTNVLEERFVIRPVVRGGDVSIWRKDRWVSGSALWSELPALCTSTLIRVENLYDSPAELSFRVQDTKTAVVYETPVKRIWSGRVWMDYVQRLNKNIAQW